MATQASETRDPSFLTATQALRALEHGELSSVELVESLIARREGLDAQINAFVHTRDEALLEEARAADEARAAGELAGPLHGLPISIKDNVAVAGTDSTLGLKARHRQPLAEDAVLVKALRRAGALVLGKTNVPQMLLAQECENAIFGVTRNPFDLGRTPGGSSGGEAAAIAAGMSPLGIGTDIGGSIRIPAHFCGLAGLKPTVDRWSNRGSQTGISGQEVVRAQIGALARTTSDLSLLWSTLDPRWQAQLDPGVAPLPAGDPAAVDLTGLRIGWFCEDGFLRPVAALRRALDLARAALEDAGATIVEHRPQPTDEIVFLWLAALSADGGRTMEASLAGEPISRQLKPSRAIAKLPAAVRRTAALALDRLGERRVARLLRVLGEKPVDDYWKLTAQRTQLRLAELDAWNRASLDAVICPPHVLPALPHGESSDFILSLGAQFRWTLLNFPAGVVPVTTVQGDEVGRYEDAGGDRLERKIDRLDRTGEGLPVGVQVVSRPYREDVTLAVMQAIEDSVARDPLYPTTPLAMRM